MPPAQAAEVSFVAALAVFDLVRAYIGPDLPRVKWPNDLMIGDEKVAGILVESGRAPDGRLWLAVGIGVNLAYSPELSERPATALALHMAGAPPKPERALERLAEAFADWTEVWQEVGFPVIATAWTERAYGLGAPCIARLPNETLAGAALGLDADGALRLRLADGTERRITAGDVFFEGG